MKEIYRFLTILTFCVSMSNTVSGRQNNLMKGASFKKYSAEQSYRMLGRAEGEESKGPLITGIDVVKFIKSIMTNYQLQPKARIAVYPEGVRYIFSEVKPEGERARKVLIRIGVFEDRDEAIMVLGKVVSSVSVGPTAIDERVGDRSYLWIAPEHLARERRNTHIRFRRKNVVVQMTLPMQAQDALRVARKIDNELENGTLFVTRGDKVAVPEIQIIDLPATIKVGQRVRHKIKVKKMDPAKLLFGSDYSISPGVVVRPGKEPEITYHAPKTAKEAGIKVISISVATLQNVVATREFKIEVIPE